MNEALYIQFEDYLSEKLSAAEKRYFEERLASDVQLKSQFETYKELSGFLEHRFSKGNNSEAFVAKLNHISENFFNAKNKQNQKPQKGFKISQLAIAASVAVLLGFFVIRSFSAPKYDDYSNHETISLTVRGNADVTVVNAQNAFNSQDFENAEIYFSELLKKEPKNIEYQLYNAISKIELNKFKEADVSLQKIIGLNSAYTNQAIWYAALSKLKQGDNNASISFLKKIPEDTIYFEKAQKLIRKLD